MGNHAALEYLAVDCLASFAKTLAQGFVAHTFINMISSEEMCGVGVGVYDDSE